ncbi:MAG: D-tagatose-bisphosphate aldolase, class II, non-catalytic subunit [Candidatus Neomarinimicrobiota bacterium]
MNHPFAEVVAAQKAGRSLGIYSVCSANRFAIEAAMLQAKADGTSLLVEATSNQVNQFGGYTGMTPQRFVAYIQDIAKSLDFPIERAILGGDHLGPNPWQGEPAASALLKACELIRAYVEAGFTKIHLDASMRLGDDSGDSQTPLDPEVIAGRSADLCQVAEEAYAERPAGSSPPLYVIGTDVPIPGGGKGGIIEHHVTSIQGAQQTICLHQQAFQKRDLPSAWERVVAVVVQPGVEFGDAMVIEYDRVRAKDLSSFIENDDQLVYEAHSTDYQTGEALRQMVEDHFAILKVGPWLTFTFREAVFALARMEAEWLANKKGITLSRIRNVLEEVMVDQPDYWRKHYRGDEAQLQYARSYSYSDRVRYYWPQREVQEALSRLLSNLTEYRVPLTLLSQYMPAQYRAVRRGRLTTIPIDLIHSKIMEVTRIYARACGHGSQSLVSEAG